MPSDAQLSSVVLLGAFVLMLVAVALRHATPPPAAAVGIDLGTTFSALGVFRTGVGSVALPLLEDDSCAHCADRRVLASRVAFVAPAREGKKLGALSRAMS